MAAETGEIVESEDNVMDGTFCSYENPHGICVQVSQSIGNSTGNLQILIFSNNEFCESTGQVSSNRLR